MILNGSCAANSYGPINVIAPIEKSELWLNPGLMSYHFDQGRDFNAGNYGFGGEYKFSSVASLTLGTYRNSHYHHSNYHQHNIINLHHHHHHHFFLSLS
jgi:hypothetical protein